MRSVLAVLALAVAPLLGAAAPTGPTGPSGATGPAKAGAPAPAHPTAAPPSTSPLVAASLAAKAARAGRSGGSTSPAKVWTLEDLEALKARHEGEVNILELPSASTIEMTAQATGATWPSAQGVQDRYKEILAEADQEIAKLQREKLAATNPLLRGLDEQSKLTPAQIDSEIAKWRDRRDTAARYVGDSSN